MRLIFAGTPVFAQRALQAVVAAGHDVALVLTRPDKPAQRGQKLLASPVKVWALEQGLEVWQPPTLRDPEAWPRLRAVAADVMVVAAYGLILPPEVLGLPGLGCLNIHASLLPRWRGAAPIQRALQAGDRQTGITIMQMDAGLDTGAMRWVRELAIGPEDSSGVVHDRLAELGGVAIVEALERLVAGTLPLTPQPAVGVTYASKITKADALIDWQAAARTITDHVRALDPSPGGVSALFGLPGQTLKIWRVQPAVAAHSEAPGTVIACSEGVIRVACGPSSEAGAVDLLELQRPGGRRMSAREFLAGYPLPVGTRFELPTVARP